MLKKKTDVVTSWLLYLIQLYAFILSFWNFICIIVVIAVLIDLNVVTGPAETSIFHIG